jgi:hypothetical protein
VRTVKPERDLVEIGFLKLDIVNVTALLVSTPEFNVYTIVICLLAYINTQLLTVIKVPVHVGLLLPMI